MQYAVETGEKRITATLRGRFTFADHQSFRELIDQFGRAAGGQVVLDMEAVEFVDSAALGMLLVASDATRGAGAALLVRRPRGQVRRTFEAADIGELFDVSDE